MIRADLIAINDENDDVTCEQGSSSSRTISETPRNIVATIRRGTLEHPRMLSEDDLLHSHYAVETTAGQKRLPRLPARSAGGVC